MIYTSYFGGIKKYKLPLERCISISRSTPAWFHGDKESRLMPSWDLVVALKNGDITPDTFKKYFVNSVLKLLDPKDIYEELDEKILLCYEVPTSFCHRHIVAEWLTANGYLAKEWEG